MSKLDEWEAVAIKSTKVVAWYPHGAEDGTVRGPFGRWFRCEPGDDQSKFYPGNKGVLASIEDDVNFAAVAMNSFQKLISVIRKQQEVIEKKGALFRLIKDRNRLNARIRGPLDNVIDVTCDQALSLTVDVEKELE